jgi:hypothetical protein
MGEKKRTKTKREGVRGKAERKREERTKYRKTELKDKI